MDSELTNCLNDYKLVLDNMTTGDYSNFNFQTKPGWFPALYALVNFAFNRAIEMKLNYQIIQAKDKFGDLLIYSRGSDSLIDAAEDVAVAFSERMCNICSTLGQKEYFDSTVAVRCYEHLSKECEYNGVRPYNHPDFLENLSKVVSLAVTKLEADAVAWLRTPHPDLQGLAPVANIIQTVSCGEVLELLK